MVITNFALFFYYYYVYQLQILDINNKTWEI